jgi:hypothetical protein
MVDHPLGPVVVFDCETDCTFASAAGFDRADQMKSMQVTVVCAEVLEAAVVDASSTTADAPEPSVEPQRITCWRDDNDAEGGPLEALFAAFDRASLIVAYNGIGFDMPVMRKYYGSAERHMSHLQKLHDPFDRIRSNTGLWVGLDAVLSRNGLPTKTGSGVDAVRLWEEGRRDELVRYCANDVTALTRLVLRRGPLEVGAKRGRDQEGGKALVVSSAVYAAGAALAALRWAQ